MWVSDQTWWVRARFQKARVDVARLRPSVVDGRLVESADDEVDGVSCLDLDLARNQNVLITGSIVWVREPVQWWVSLPLAEADRGLTVRAIGCHGRRNHQRNQHENDGAALCRSAMLPASRPPPRCPRG